MPSEALSFFLTARMDDVIFDCVEIYHPAFSQVYRKVRNNADGLTVRHETGATLYHYEWYPMEITELGESADLDNGRRIDFGDLGEILPLELDNVAAADMFHVKPTITYRAYKSTDLNYPLVGPLILEAPSFSFNQMGASFEAVAPYVNRNKTGETYNLTRFPMLRGFLK